MFRQEASSRADLESAEAQLAVTRAELQSAQADIDNALIKVERTKTELGYNRIQAPMDGTVVSIVTRQGQTLAASQTVPTLLKLANLDTMTVKAQISEADVTKVRAGMPVYFTLIGDPDRRYHGTLRTVELAPTNINEQSANTTTTSNAAIYYYALFDVPNPDHQLRVAMTTQVTIVLGERKQVLAIPQTALGKKLGENEYEVTLLKEDGQKETRRIKTGMKDDIKIEVVSGLNEQDKVILDQGKPVQHDEMEMVP
ncbi:Macrolide export protein MacA [compost metagenome]